MSDSNLELNLDNEDESKKIILTLATNGTVDEINELLRDQDKKIIEEVISIILNKRKRILNDRIFQLVEVDRSFEVFENKDNENNELIRYIPTGMEIDIYSDREDLKQTCRIYNIVNVILGGYANLDVVVYSDVKDGIYKYISVHLADSYFNIKELLNICGNKPFNNLSEDERKFMMNYYNKDKK